jgi:hypothetical protein
LPANVGLHAATASALNMHYVGPFGIISSNEGFGPLRPLEVLDACGHVRYCLANGIHARPVTMQERVRALSR